MAAAPVSAAPAMDPRPEHPAMLPLKLWLSIHTHIDPYEFADWIRANLSNLRHQFDQCDEPTDTDRRVENCQGIWLRQTFVSCRRTAA